ncbi:MAG: DUF4258 domain-containing protein [Chitinophagaceae bacterium]
MTLLKENILDCKKVQIGEHSFKRMFERRIETEDVLQVVYSGEIIKQYSDEKPYPAYLMLKFVKHKPIHIIVAKNNENGSCFIVTVYEPDPELWSADFKTKIK